MSGLISISCLERVAGAFCRFSRDMSRRGHGAAEISVSRGSFLPLRLTNSLADSISRRKFALWFAVHTVNTVGSVGENSVSGSR